MQSQTKKIERLQTKVAKITEKLTSEIQSICDKLDYTNGSRFSYNIDRIQRFNEELKEFQIYNSNN